jgi:hypothetical protein
MASSGLRFGNSRIWIPLHVKVKGHW